MKLATFTSPHIGGTWTVAQNLHDGLKNHGIDVNWLGFNSRAHQAYENPDFADAQKWGKIIGTAEDEKEQARLISDYLVNNKYDGIFVDVLASRVIANLCIYLPEYIRRIMIVHNISVGTYTVASAIRKYVHYVVAISPGIYKDLKRKGFECDYMQYIPHGLKFSGKIKNTSSNGKLRLIYLGRLEEKSKGIYCLPKILKKIKSPAILDIYGTGPDESALREQCNAALNIALRGQVNPKNVVETFAQYNIFVMPSNFEGFGYTIIEAMAAGCVPIVSKIKGITDAIIDDGENGFLFPVGDVQKAAKIIDDLASNRQLLCNVSKNAQETAYSKYSLEVNAKSYAGIIESVMTNPRQLPRIKNLSEWSYPSALKGGLIRRYLPQSWRDNLRILRAKLR